MNRGNIATLAFVVLCVGGAAGMLLTGWSPFTSPAVRAAFTVPVLPTPTTMSAQMRAALTQEALPATKPVPATRLARLTSHGTLKDWPILTDRGEQEAYSSAIAAHDIARMQQIGRAVTSGGRYIGVAEGEPVRVIQSDQRLAQVEIISGPEAGRRGWVNVGDLIE